MKVEVRRRLPGNITDFIMLMEVEFMPRVGETISSPHHDNYTVKQIEHVVHPTASTNIIIWIED